MLSTPDTFIGATQTHEVEVGIDFDAVTKNN